MLRHRLKDAARMVYERAPATRRALDATNNLLHQPSFSGWGMTTRHALPWDDEHDWQHFRSALAEVEAGFEHGLRNDTGITPGVVHTLSWRHWFVSFSVRYACRFNPLPDLQLAECGVGDGLTTYFACNEAAAEGASYMMHCYDTWGPVEIDDPSRNYAAISLERAKRNLHRFDGRVDYHVGRIPESLEEGAPDHVNYLSVDLNAAAPTIAALDFFLPRMAPRGVVLFDDYGFVGYDKTKAALDEYFQDLPGVLLKMPTGQAAWIT